MKSKTSPWSPADLASLTALCERADRMDGITTPPWLASSRSPLDGVRLSEFIERYTVGAREKLLADMESHPIYQRLVANVPRAVTVPAPSLFDPLRRARAIANDITQPLPGNRRKTTGRLDKKRKAELNATRRLQQITTSPVRKRVLAEWVQELQQSSPIAFGKIDLPGFFGPRDYSAISYSLALSEAIKASRAAAIAARVLMVRCW